jgi:hypothetical protein
VLQEIPTKPGEYVTYACYDVAASHDIKTIIGKGLVRESLSLDTYKMNNKISEVKDAAGHGQGVRYVDFQPTMKCKIQNCTFTCWYQSTTVTTSLTSMHKGWLEDYEEVHRKLLIRLFLF